MSINHARIACKLHNETTVQFYINVFDLTATRIVIRVWIAIQKKIWIAIQTRFTIQIFFWIAIHSVHDHDPDRQPTTLPQRSLRIKLKIFNIFNS